MLSACSEESPRAIEERAVARSIRPGAPPSEVEPIDAVPIAPAPLRVVITAAGDLVLNAFAMGSVRAHASEEEGYRALLDGYARSLREDEIAYLNLEMPLVDDEIPLDPGWPRSITTQARRSPVLGGTPALAHVLASIGVDVVGLANNHAYDQGHAGLRRTIEALDAVDLAHAGASQVEQDAYDPVSIQRDGARVAWISLTTSFNRTSEGDPRVIVAHVSRPERLERAIATARAAADVVVVAVHWSTDFVMDADPEQRALGARLVELGADVVLGTGPHVLQQVVRVPSARGEAVIAYSLGNVASGMGRAYRLGHPPHDYIHPANVRPEARDGLVLRIALAIDGGRIAIERLEGVPLWTENDFLSHTPRGAASVIRVVPLAEAAAAVRAERMPAIRAAIGDAVELTTP